MKSKKKRVIYIIIIFCILIAAIITASIKTNSKKSVTAATSPSYSDKTDKSVLSEKPKSSSTKKAENKTSSKAETTAANKSSASKSVSILSSENKSTAKPKSSSVSKVSSKSAKPKTTAKAKNAIRPTYINGILIANKTYPLPSNYNPGVNPSAKSAFNKMAADAGKQGISLRIVSGFRSYSTQASIYKNYVARDGKAAADRYSARPGHSEHQTGLAFDVNSLYQSFENTKEGKWLAANCYKYGFIIRYPKGKENVTGYMYEPWHIRYLGISTATAVYNSGLSLEEYLGITSEY